MRICQLELGIYNNGIKEEDEDMNLKPSKFGEPTL
jgi:hypothetical protein